MNAFNQNFETFQNLDVDPCGYDTDSYVLAGCHTDPLRRDTDWPSVASAESVKGVCLGLNGVSCGQKNPSFGIIIRHHEAKLSTDHF